VISETPVVHLYVDRFVRIVHESHGMHDRRHVAVCIYRRYGVGLCTTNRHGQKQTAGQKVRYRISETCNIVAERKKQIGFVSFSYAIVRKFPQKRDSTD